ncbi:unnamed protein product [Cochlearia groenlandica]
MAGEFVVVSQVRTGCKRELQFVLKSQSEICGGESLGRTRGSRNSNSDGSGLKKMRLSNNDCNNVLVVSDTLGFGLGESKSDVVDIDSASLVEYVSENVEIDDDDEKDYRPGRELVLACPANRSVLAAKTGSRSCNVKLQRGIVSAKPCRRFTRSMLKVKSVEPGDSINQESEDNGVDAFSIVPYVSEEERGVGPCRRLTRSMLKPESVTSEANCSEDNRVDAFSLVPYVSEEELHEQNSVDMKALDANDVGMDDVQSLSVITPVKHGNPGKVYKNFPTKLREIFDSRILEGLTVYYLRSAKTREAGARGLKGVIKGSGVLCFCNVCRGTQVVSPAVFESHAFSTNKRPPEYILLESGFTLRDVMNACKQTPLAMLEEKLRVVVGPNLQKSSMCLSCQDQIVEPCDTKSLVLCKSCLERKEPEPQTHPSKADDAVKRSSEPGVVPGTLSETKTNSIKSHSKGKLTRKDQRLHKLVFEDDILPDGTEVGYFLAGKKLLVGYKKGFGIHCSCCNKVVSPSSFEAHAGCASRRKPFQQIYTTNGVSLHELSVALSMDQRFSIRENDDLCSICQDGGDLLCCDTCPRSYHIVCASLPSLPIEKWSCKYCVNMIEREKFVNSNQNAVAAGRVDGVDAIAQITQRCIRIVSSFGSELPSVCVLCRGHSFCRMGFNSRTVIICDQCEKEFHVGCLKEHNIADLKELPEEQWFCSLVCKKINTSLSSLVVYGEEKLSNNFLKNFIRKKQKPDEENCQDDNITHDISWKVLSGKVASSDDTKLLLAKAVSILHERFDPISDNGSRGDLIPAMVYGRKTKGQDFSGMYCTMLTVDEVIVSVGIFRVFGSELAELPLVATSKDCQGKGYFQCLFACIEKLLGFLNVKHLVLPAAEEAKSIWTDKFGFTKMTHEEVNEYRKDFSVMVFHGTSMLRKTVPDPKTTRKPDESTE